MTQQNPRIGDLIIEINSKSIGILTGKKKKIYVDEDEVYYWIVHWVFGSNMTPYIEEEYLIYCLESGIFTILGGQKDDQ